MTANSPAAPVAGVSPCAGAGRWSIRRGARRLRFLLTLSGACFGLHGRAADPPPPVGPAFLLPPWVVEERRARPPAAARTETLAATLGAGSVVADAAGAGRSVGTLAEALRRAPGVLLQESFGGFEPPRLSLRGSGLDSAPSARGVALLVDGLPLARADGSFHSGLFVPALFARIEIHRGPMAAALAPAVLGGGVNVVTPPPAAAAETTLRCEAGDADTLRAQLTHRAPAARLALAHARAGGWREHSAQERHAFEAAVRPGFGAPLQLELAALAVAARYEVPGPLTLADAFARPRSIALATQRDAPRRRSELVRVSARLRTEPGPATLAAGLAGQRLRDDFFQLQANGETEATSDDVSGHLTFSRRSRGAGPEHHALVRATATTGVNRAARFLNDAGRRGRRFGAYAARADTTALSIEDLVWLDGAFAVGAGATVGHAGRTLRERRPSAGIAREFALTDVSPRAGVAWRTGAGATVHVAWSRGSEPPAFDDLVAVTGTYPDLTLRSRELRAQRATTLEVGVRGAAGLLDWDVTAYRSAWRDEILRLTDAAGQPRGASNAGPTTHAGVESALHWRLTGPPHRLGLHVVSTLGSFRFVDDPVHGDNRIAGVPPHVGAAELVYDHARGGFAAIESTWSAGRTWADHAGRLGYGGHALLHARVGWRAGGRGRGTVFVAVRNLLDRAHLASTAGVLDVARAPAATAIFLPGTGRSLTLGFEWHP